MAKTSLIISATGSGGKTVQKTVTVVNPHASNEKLTTLGQMLNSLTTNTYQTTTRIDKVNCDTETKTQRTITTFNVTSTGVQITDYTQPVSVPLSKVNTKGSGYSFALTYRDNSTAQVGCAMPYLKNFSSSDYETLKMYSVIWYCDLYSAAPSSWSISVYLNEKAVGSFTATFHVDEDDNYTALDIPLTFNIVDDSQGG